MKILKYLFQKLFLRQFVVFVYEVYVITDYGYMPTTDGNIMVKTDELIVYSSSHTNAIKKAKKIIYKLDKYKDKNKDFIYFNVIDAIVFKDNNLTEHLNFNLLK